MHARRIHTFALLSMTLLLSACGGSSNSPPDVAKISVSGARSAAVETAQLLSTVRLPVRPAALLNIYVAIVLADGMPVPVTAAMQGVEAQLALHELPNEENIDTLYSLLQEFGAVLHVDIQDLLNRSPNRAETLDAYAIGLRNITERSNRRAVELEEGIDSAKKEQQEQRKIVSQVEKALKEAVAAKDFTSAQDHQEDVNVARAELARRESLVKELTTLHGLFEDLLEVAQKRIAAIDGNREVLIAGLKVVDVPGVEDLGVLEGRVNRYRSGRASPFGGL